MIKLTSLFSGSHGNCLLVSADDTNILIDAGMTYTTLKRSLSNIDLTPQDIDAVVITHEHNDHISALPYWCLHNKSIPVYAHRSIAYILEDKVKTGNIKAFDGNFTIKDLSVEWLKCHHDSVFCCGYRFDDGVSKVATVTDTGHIDDKLLEFLQPCRTVLLESNHDVTMVNRGNYPYRLKQRILSDNGHLSNAQCGQVLDYLIKQGNLHNIVLGHLSQNNNTSEIAFCDANTVIKNNGLLEGKDIKLFVAQQYERSKTIE